MRLEEELKNIVPLDVLRRLYSRAIFVSFNTSYYNSMTKNSLCDYLHN